MLGGDRKKNLRAMAAGPTGAPSSSGRKCSTKTLRERCDRAVVFLEYWRATEPKTGRSLTKEHKYLVSSVRLQLFVITRSWSDAK